jgi:hypothetical protein
VTPGERRRIARLDRVEELLTTRAARGGPAVTTASLSADGGAASGALSDGGAVSATEGSQASGGSHEGGAAAAPGSADDKRRSIFPGFPSPDGGTAMSILVVAAAIMLSFAAVAFGLAVLPRHVVPAGVRPWFDRSRVDLAAVGFVVLAAMALMFLVA